MICNKCNNKLPDDSEFCQYCGSKIKTVVNDSNAALVSDDILRDVARIHAEVSTDAVQANATSQPDNEGNDDFGLVPENPIYTLAARSVYGEEEYLDSLRTLDGQKIKYNRRGSMSVEGVHGMIDIYDTFLPSGDPYKTIYVNMYGAKKSTSVPCGFSLKEETINSANTKVRKTKPTINNKILLTIISASVAVVMLSIWWFYILFHQHDYTIVSYNAPTCSTAGYKIFECSRCSHSYTESIDASHQYVVSQKTDATCTSQGNQTLECSTCHDAYSEIIPIKSHSYTLATCTQPRTCSECGTTTGSALEHTNNAVCTKCGAATFNTLIYSGTGSKVIKNIIVPDGRFIISGYAGGTGVFSVDLRYGNGNLATGWYEYLTSSNQTTEKAASFNGVVNGGILEIDAADNISWTIIIEAVGN